MHPFVNPEGELAGNRLHDAKVGPGGAIWVGSVRMDASCPSEGLYRVTCQECVSRMESGIAVSKGMDWSPDNATFYSVDTVPERLYTYDCVPGEGILRNRRVFATVPEQDGHPVGLTVDASGGVCCAIWDGRRINRYLSDGNAGPRDRLAGASTHQRRVRWNGHEHSLHHKFPHALAGNDAVGSAPVRRPVCLFAC